MQATKFAVDPGWRVILKDIGMNENEVLKRAELPRDLFTRKNAFLSTDEYFRLWKGLEASLNDPSFPLRIGQTISTESFSPPIFASLCSPNLNVAMQRLSRYKQLIGPMTLTVKKGSKATTITLDCLFTNKPLPDSLIAMELVYLVHLVRLGTREQINPIAMSSSTLWLNRDDYAAYFGVSPVKGKQHTLTFSAQDSVRPFLTENEKMWEFFEPELRKRLTELDAGASYASRVRGCLFELLPTGLSSAEDVAKNLAISKRTLQRHLGNENTSFQQELNTTRESLARHYLTNSTYSGAEISFLLGFEDPNSFFRAFRSWTGETPENVRTQTMH
ncbi:MAG: helix-turn-helix domain-containing protein [Desulfobacterales bacterium]|nr:helix-turn-helix domain-containing protein [Desulfobacterales bacterium]